MAFLLIAALLLSVWLWGWRMFSYYLNEWSRLAKVFIVLDYRDLIGVTANN